ncbi:hypothetical protein PHYPO_G00004850 [Pangasianodon hypophthalmus]|uniref:TNFR-Cys domain-containing protein n=1 Tax=Pangasianodon hypophthalmus TaxID=310915 RepID=A0A5N5Q424_PANHP|nr:hypothetical protein PHYPO_G00004850 [Pangasianodon hypophthalmus]
MACSPDEHEHKGSCCKKCPKGKHVSSYCAASSQTECAQCRSGFYTETDNFIDDCLPCRSCDPNNHLQTSKYCTADSNTKCKCMEGFYCTQTSGNCQDHCEKCELVHRCPPGQGVSVPSNSTRNTVCKLCPPGTFNKETDYVTPCQNHTSCSDLGRSLISPGTAETDAVCGDFIHRCHWMIPASLWAGLILTLMLIMIGVIYLKCKRRGKAVITLVTSENFVPPALPPDVIKYPGSPELQTLTHSSKLCAEEDDGTLETDGVSVNMFLEKCGALYIPDTCMSYISEPYRSEPQEDDWPVP